MRGHVTRRVADACLFEAVELVQTHPGIHITVWDYSEMTSFDPGIPAVIIRWSREHLTTHTHGVVVTRNHAITGLVRVAQVMIPWIKGEILARRQDVPMLLAELLPTRRSTAA